MKLLKKNFLNLLIITFVFTMITTLNIFAKSFNVNEFTSNGLLSVAFYNNVYVIASESIYTSKDGITWDTTFSSDIDGHYDTITVLNDMFIATGKNVQTVKSLDGVNWSPLRLHESISPKKIYALGKTYFWINSENELHYSYNLLTWTSVPMPSGQKLLSANFVNNKCFLSSGVSAYRPNYFVLSEDLTLKTIDKSITSIEDIYYSAQTNTYIQFLNSKSIYSKSLQLLRSTDGQHWEKLSVFLPNTTVNDTNSEYTVTVIGGQLFLNLNNNTYTTNDGSNWKIIGDGGDYKNIQFSGKYFYNTSNSNTLTLSEDGITWYDYPIDEKSIFSTTLVLGDSIFIVSPNFDTSKNKYNSKLYSYLITAITQQNTQENEAYLLKLKIASNKIELKEGSVIEIDPAPFVEQSNTLVPLRSIITALNGTLTWDASTNKITLYCNNKTMELWTNSVSATVDGKPFNLPIETKSINNKTVVAIRPIIENLGYTVEWLNHSNEIIIKK